MSPNASPSREGTGGSTETVEKNVELGQFVLNRHIADGAQCSVYKTTCHGVPAVIKLVQQGHEAEARAIAEQDLSREASILSRMESHPGVCRMMASGTNPVQFLVLEKLEGKTLGARLGTDRPQPVNVVTWGKRRKLAASFPLPERLALGFQLAEVLAHIHSSAIPGACVIHRDLKPANVGFRRDGRLCLFDFGLSRVLHPQESLTGLYQMTGATGSQRYMAPEVALNRPYNEKADIYSLGLILWEMCALARPFAKMACATHHHRVILGGARPPHGKGWPQELKALLEACWAAEATDRPTATHVARQLRAIVSHQAKGKNFAP